MTGTADKRYKFYRQGNTIYAVTTFAGKTVRAKATCAPDDKFSEDVGRRLAYARCTLKVATKRRKRAEDCVRVSKENVARARRYRDKMKAYRADARAAESAAKTALRLAEQAVEL